MFHKLIFVNKFWLFTTFSKDIKSYTFSAHIKHKKYNLKFNHRPESHINKVYSRQRRTVSKALEWNDTMATCSNDALNVFKAL